MSLFRKLFGKTPNPADKLAGDEKALSDQLSAAEKRHKEATFAVKRSSINQVSEAEYIRETMRGLLCRIEQRKVEK